MVKKIKDKKNMESLKKTAKAYGTVSEEEVKAKFKDDKEVLKDILEEEDLVEIEKEVVEEKKEIKPYQRKDRKVEERIAHLAGWVPKTKLGKDVRNGKIKK